MLHIAILLQSPLRADAPAPPRSSAPRLYSHLPSGSAGRDEKKGGGRDFILHAEQTGRGVPPTGRGSPDRRRLSSLAGAARDAGQTAVVGALLARRLPLAAGR